MKTTLLIFLMLALFGFPLYMAYWRLFRPVLIQRLKYRMFEARDRLRILALTGIAKGERAYPIIESMCNKTIQKIDHVDFADVILFKPDAKTSLEVERDLETIQRAKAELRDVFQTMRSVLVGSVLVNSPGIILLIIPFAFIALFAYWIDCVKGLLTRIQVRVLSVSYATAS